MFKFFLKVFGLVIALLSAIALLVAGVILAFYCHLVVGIIATALAISGFVAGVITIIEYNWWKV